MKKIHRILILTSSLLLAACAPTQSSGPVTVASDVLAATATIDGQSIPVTSGAKVTLQTTDYSLVVAFEPDVLMTDPFLNGPKSFQFALKNLGTGVIKIVWDDSAININGTSSIVFHNGVKYADRGNPKPATIIAPGTSTDDNVLPQDLTSFESYGSSIPAKWVSNPMITMIKSNTKLGLLLALDVNGKRQNVNIIWAAK